jgi:3-dehydroquinate synthase
MKFSEIKKKHQNNILNIKQTVEASYSVHFIKGLFKKNNHNENPLLMLCKGNKLIIVVDENVYKKFGREIEQFFSMNGCNFILHKLNASEKNKTISSVIRLCDMAKKNRIQRNSIFIAIGGGITLDIVGFAASIFRRRTPYIKIPTTIVGIIDAGVGVKVGINFGKSKNFLGGYYPPLAVFNDQSFLKTLTAKEIRCGLYELIKIALIKDPSLYYLIERYYRDLMENDFNKRTEEMIFLAASLLIKELTVDLLESNLQRLVDFGHTFSPCLEMKSENEIPHGEAVGIDILISSHIAFKKNLLSQADFDSIFSLIKSIGFSKKYSLPKAKQLYSSLDDIRCHRAGSLNLVLPNRIGAGNFTNYCSVEEIKHAMDFICDSEMFQRN